MTDKEARLVIRMLQEYANHLGNAGSNDTDPSWLAEFTEAERIEMNREFEMLNGTPEEFDGTARMMPDFCYVALMEHKLRSGIHEVG
jgi:hypothetical protein